MSSVQTYSLNCRLLSVDIGSALVKTVSDDPVKGEATSVHDAEVHCCICCTADVSVILSDVTLFDC